MNSVNFTKKSVAKSTQHHPPRPLKLWQDISPSQEVRIEMLPLIDVIFCILTFFILAAVGLSRQQAISLDLPKASTGKPQMREMLLVSLDNLGQVYLEKQLVTKNQLQAAIQNYHQLNPNGLMVLNASRYASYNEVIAILDILKQVGGDRVALATLPGEATPSNDPNSPNNLNLPYSGVNPYLYPNQSSPNYVNPLQPNQPQYNPNQSQFNPNPNQPQQNYQLAPNNQITPNLPSPPSEAIPPSQNNSTSN